MTWPLALTWQAADRARALTWIAGAVLVVGAGIAAWGLPPVDLHGPLHYAGIMDPFCGGTRGLRYALRGQVAEAWRYNPLSLAVVAVAVAVLARTGIGRLTGRWVTVQVTSRPVVVVAVALALIALEIRQQSLAPLLLQPGP